MKCRYLGQKIGYMHRSNTRMDAWSDWLLIMKFALKFYVGQFKLIFYT